MAVVVINGEQAGVHDPARTWGELLERLDARLAASDEVMTAVRLNGVDEPSFRSAEALVTPLDTDASVFVQTARPADSDSGRPRRSGEGLRGDPR